MGATKEEIAAVLREAEERAAARFRSRLIVLFLAVVIAGVVTWKVRTVAAAREKARADAERLVEQQKEQIRLSRESQMRVREILGGK